MQSCAKHGKSVLLRYKAAGTEGHRTDNRAGNKEKGIPHTAESLKVGEYFPDLGDPGSLSYEKLY